MSIKYYEIKNGAIINGNCLEVLKGIKDNVIDMVITSPPYDDIRSYGGTLVWNENVWRQVIKNLYRIVKDGGVVVWIVNDKYKKGGRTLTSFRQALYFQEVGFLVHDVMIWNKKSIIFTTVNRYMQVYEFMIVSSKGKPKTHNLIKDKLNITYGKVKNKIIMRVDEKIMCKNKTIEAKKYGVRTNIWTQVIGSNKSYPNDKIIRKHPAIFPLQLIKDHIISWSNEGDIILDPFAGSGTVGVACEQLKRRYILIEKVEDYIDIIKYRIMNNK